MSEQKDAPILLAEWILRYENNSYHPSRRSNFALVQAYLHEPVNERTEDPVFSRDRWYRAAKKLTAEQIEDSLSCAGMQFIREKFFTPEAPSGDPWLFCTYMLEMCQYLMMTEALLNAKAVLHGDPDSFCRSSDGEAAQRWAKDILASLRSLSRMKPAGGVQ